MKDGVFSKDISEPPCLQKEKCENETQKLAFLHVYDSSRQPKENKARFHVNLGFTNRYDMLLGRIVWMILMIVIFVMPIPVDL